MVDLDNAKHTLKNGSYTCVLCKENQNYTSNLRGVKSLVLWLKSDIDFKNFSAADKVIGKATAFLYVLLKVKSVFASVISKPALEVLKINNISVSYETLAENIINRKGDGICPFEEAVLNVATPETAYKVILNKMQELNIEL